ncbi:hypothetical protein HYN48_13310 [Flavobacterium magnum]|uniref:Uncharacterized protein n=1 Tax=Flavobacterium magnum TaxID=2162713 RepID=A0A2S0RID5_9FLAO|nr:hypothetical protein [Flavobacterium magnum]AWA30978.1 hypothetical protein HYN48_13310 [Flavobacterium magnum]
MKERLYKNIALALVAINIWTLYSFFDYYNATKYSMSSLTLFFNFIDSVFAALAIGIIAVILRLTIFRTKRKKLLKNNFFYVLCGLFNLNLFIIWIVSLLMKLLPLKLESTYFMLGSLIITIFILFDLFLNKNEIRQMEIENT